MSDKSDFVIFNAIVCKYRGCRASEIVRMSDPLDLSALLEDIRVLAPRAVQSERAGQLEHAAFCYREAARLLALAVQMGAEQVAADLDILYLCF